MKKEIVEDLIMNLKDAGCDEELITQCIKKYNNDDLKCSSNHYSVIVVVY